MEGCSYYKETSPATQTVCRWALSQREEEGNLLAKILDTVLKNVPCGSLVMPAVNYNKGCNKRSQKKTPINNLTGKVLILSIILGERMCKPGSKCLPLSSLCVYKYIYLNLR